jgi:putative FmdB family regulatory protein
MPIYEYQCQACQYQFDAMQKISDHPLTQCPKCQQDSLQKLISAAGFQLKGSGWYASDYKSKPKPAHSEEKSSVSTETKAESNTKPAESSEK